MRLGIDFGTVNSCAAVLTPSGLALVRDPIKAGFVLPSSVYATPEGELLVGHAAEAQRDLDAGRFRREFKRDLGQDEPIPLGGRGYQPEDLVVGVLQALKREAEAMVDGQGTIDGAVVTIPATYQSHRRRLMLEAAGRAGFAHVDLLEEPVAAAKYYRSTREGVDGETLLIYDLGGGTFDAALVRRGEAGYELVAPPMGDEHCGGLDFDRAIFRDLLARGSEALRGRLDPQRHDDAARRGRAQAADLCREMKHQLSASREARRLVTLVEPPEPYHLTRVEFESWLAPHLATTAEVCRRLLADASVAWDRVDALLLVGGSCRVPRVKEFLEREFGRPVHRIDDPELAVCKGAALRGAELDRPAAPDPEPPGQPPSERSDARDYQLFKDPFQAFRRRR